MAERLDRRLGGLDRLIVVLDRALRAAAQADCGAGPRRRAEGAWAEGATDDTFDGRERRHPAGGMAHEAPGERGRGPLPDGTLRDDVLVRDDVLDGRERRRAAGLMRVNHAGEVAAQALYRGQSLAARDTAVRAAMEEAAREESDHLAWCRTRLEELGASPSRLDPLWYAGSFALGATAGLAGDRWSLGFVVETERQVVEHLDDHLARLPAGDRRSRALLERMRADEQRHATRAHAAGAAALPPIVRGAMRAASKVMTRSAYWI